MQQSDVLLVQFHGPSVKVKSFFEVLHPDFAAAQSDSRFNVRGSHGKDVLVLLAGGPIVEVVKQNSSQIEAGFKVLGVGLDGLVKIHHRLGGIAEFKVSQPQVVEGLGRELVQRQNLVLKNPPGDLQILSEDIDKTASIESDDVAGLNCQHVLDEVLSSGYEVKLLGLVHLPLCLHEPIESQGIVGFDIVRRLDNHLVKEVLRLAFKFHCGGVFPLLPRLTGLGEVDLANVRPG